MTRDPHDATDWQLANNHPRGVDELIALAKDRSQGHSRLLLLRGLKKSKSAKAKRALEELASDPVLAKEIASWRKVG